MADSAKPKAQCWAPAAGRYMQQSQVRIALLCNTHCEALGRFSIFRGQSKRISEERGEGWEAKFLTGDGQQEQLGGSCPRASKHNSPLSPMDSTSTKGLELSP